MNDDQHYSCEEGYEDQPPHEHQYLGSHEAFNQFANLSFPHDGTLHHNFLYVLTVSHDERRRGTRGSVEGTHQIWRGLCLGHIAVYADGVVDEREEELVSQQA